MTGNLSEEQILSMSDEDIMNMTGPSEEPALEPAASVEEPPVTEPTVEPEVTTESQPVEEPEQQPEPSVDVDPSKPVEAVADKPVTTTEPAKEEPTPVNYEAEYNRIMAPFKANGKEVKLQNPDDVIRLMQMGANYTKKMQALQPNMKLLKMLENQGLLDEGKLNYLIDIHKGNPAAIQQLVKQSGIDPLEIDTSKDPGYVPGNHSVSDKELQFNNILNDVSSTQEGADIIVAIDKQWDDASKQALYNEPEILTHLLNQKQSGVFDQIAGEVERRRILGELANMPFIQAYHIVGQHMQTNNLLKGMQPAPTVVETRTAAPAVKPPVVNSDKARAASPTKAAPQTVKQELNPLAMSDEEFMKMANFNL